MSSSCDFKSKPASFDYLQALGHSGSSTPIHDYNPNGGTAVPVPNQGIYPTPNVAPFLPPPTYPSGYTSTTTLRQVACDVCKQRGKIRKWKLDAVRDKMVKDGWQDCPTCQGALFVYVTEFGSNGYISTEPAYPQYPLVTYNINNVSEES